MSLLLSLPLQSYSLRKSSSTWPRTSRGDFWYGRKPRTTIFTTACLGLYYCLVRPLLLPVLLLMSVHHTFTHVWSLYSAITVLRCIFTTQCNHCNYGVSLLHSAITVTTVYLYYTVQSLYHCVSLLHRTTTGRCSI